MCVDRETKKEKEKIVCKRGSCLKKVTTKGGTTCSADGGRDLSLFSKLVRSIILKILLNVANATSYPFFSKLSAWLQTFHAEWSKMTTGRHFYRPIGSNKFRLNPKLLAKLAKLGTLSINLPLSQRTFLKESDAIFRMFCILWWVSTNCLSFICF